MVLFVLEVNVLAVLYLLRRVVLCEGTNTHTRTPHHHHPSCIALPHPSSLPPTRDSPFTAYAQLALVVVRPLSKYIFSPVFLGGSMLAAIAFSALRATSSLRENRRTTGMLYPMTR
jgi:hypothetical protein